MTRIVGDHLWQSTLFAIAAAILAAAFSRNRAQVRYAVWVTASAKFLLPLAALIALGERLGWSPARHTFDAGSVVPSAATWIVEMIGPFSTHDVHPAGL